MDGRDDQFRPSDDAWEAVLASLCHLQSVLPDAVLVGGTASALYAGHRFSLDHDHVLSDLRQRFDAVLDQLEAVAGWETARINRPGLILGSLDGVETGVRQLRRARVLETRLMRVGGHDVTLPTLPEVLRIKAFLCLDRNATRDYLDVAALAAHLGMQQAGEALRSMDELYPQKNGDPWAVRAQLIMQLAAPPPYDLDRVELAQYKGVRPPFDRWGHVAETCGRLSDRLLEDCMELLRADPSPAARQAQATIDAWRDARIRPGPAARQTSGASIVKHRHLSHEEFSVAAIEDILARGRLPDWAPLIAAIQDDPFGEVAEKTRVLCERALYASPVFRRVIAAARQSRGPTHTK